MKRYFVLLFILIPYISPAQSSCTTAYIHTKQIIDSLPVPQTIQHRLDSMQKAQKTDLQQKEKQIRLQYKDKKEAAKKIREAAYTNKKLLEKEKYKLLNDYYGPKIREASIKIYDKGKKYQTVFNADNPYFSKIPDNSCDVTSTCLKMVRESLK